LKDPAVETRTIAASLESLLLIAQVSETWPPPTSVPDRAIAVGALTKKSSVYVPPLSASDCPVKFGGASPLEVASALPDIVTDVEFSTPFEPVSVNEIAPLAVALSFPSSLLKSRLQLPESDHDATPAGDCESLPQSEALSNVPAW